MSKHCGWSYRIEVKASYDDQHMDPRAVEEKHGFPTQKLAAKAAARATSQWLGHACWTDVTVMVRVYWFDLFEGLKE